MKKGMIILLIFLLLSLSFTACELHTRKGELMSVTPSGTNSETINKVEDVVDKLQGMNSTGNVITEVQQVILDYYAAYIEIYKGADIHIIENYLDMDRIQSQNIVSALEMADFSRKYISDEYGIEPEIKDDYPYTVNFLNTSFNGENTCNIRLSIDMEATAYPPAFSASEQEYQLEKENDSWKITHHTWDGMAVFEVSDTELLNWDREARISILQSIYGNGK